MPGSVQPITAELDSFPASFSKALTTSYHREARINEYPDGSSQRQSDVTTSTRSWQFSKRLTAAQMQTLKAFYLAHITAPFLFYDLLSGTNVKAVFTSPWSETFEMGRFTISLSLTEVY
jgi:hypothetical protein